MKNIRFVLLMLLFSPFFLVGQSARVFTLKGKVVDVEGGGII